MYKTTNSVACQDYEYTEDVYQHGFDFTINSQGDGGSDDEEGEEGEDCDESDSGQTSGSDDDREVLEYDDAEEVSW